MAGFGASIQAAAPVLLGIGSQASGRDPAGIARGIALLEAKQERDQRKAAIENMMSGMGISGSQKSFLSSLPVEAQQQYILQQMAPKEPVRGVVMGDRLVNPYTGEPMANFGPEPLPADLFGDGGYVGYSNQGATRSGPLNTPLVQAFDFLPDMGVSMEVFSGGQPAEGPNRVGSTRHDHGNAADVFFHKDGRRLDWRNEADIPILQDIVAKAKANGVTGFGAGDGYMQPGSMHVGFGAPAVWGAGGKGENAPEWLRAAYNGATAGAQPPQQAQAMPQVAQLDATIDRMTAILATGRGTDAQRKQLEFKRSQLVSERDRLRAQNEKDHLAALRARAEAGGLEEGSPEWQQFMLNNGAGGTAFTVSPDGTVSYGTGAAAANVKFNETESKTNTYAVRAKGALEALDSVGAEHLTSRVNRGLDSVPMGIGRELQSEEFQVAQQAGDEFLQAILRKDTGAAITTGEQAMYGDTYLPRPGDGPRVIEAKRKARIRAIAALESGMSAAQQAATDRAIISAEARAEGGSEGSQPDQTVQLLGPDQGLFEKYGVPTE